MDNAALKIEERVKLMTMGLKVQALLNEKEIKKRARTRKAESDAILENIYALLMEKKGEKKSNSGLVKKMVN